MYIFASQKSLKGHWRIWLARNTGSVEVIGSSPICSTNIKHIVNNYVLFIYPPTTFPRKRFQKQVKAHPINP